MMLLLLIAVLVVNGASLVLAAVIGQSLRRSGRSLTLSEFRTAMLAMLSFSMVGLAMAYMAGGIQ